MLHRFLPIVTLLWFAISCSSTIAQNSHSSIAKASIVEGASAHWISADRLLWDVGPNAHRVELRYSETANIIITEQESRGGEVIPLTKNATVDEGLADKFRHISGRSAFGVSAPSGILHTALRSQLIAVAYNEDGKPIAATKVQPHGVLDDLFTYNGPLGPIYRDNSIELALWAPTAQQVQLNLYNDEKEPISTHTTQRNENGVWRFRLDRDLDRALYRFTITTYHPASGEIHTYEVTDPYSVSLTTNSEYSRLADLYNDAELKPEGWDAIRKVQPHPADISLYEMHIRDFSMADHTVPELHRGTYLAFTHNGVNDVPASIGMSHLKRLRGAGLTHIHLLPVNDIATIFEDRERRVELHDPYRRLCDVIGHDSLEEACQAYGDRTIGDVFKELASENPVTEEIQHTMHGPGRMAGFARHSGFNWGYDPFHFNTPQGSYSTNPEGTERILEFREMVKSLHEVDLKLVVDVVYNHTNASGLADRSVLDRIVPWYYHRLNPDTGDVETSTCCDNTAAEFAMMEKLMIDSIVLWAKAYKIDSFRFDLMGHHPRSVMENIQDALAELTLDEDGVDGASIYIYGEGWDFGEVAGNRIFEQATQFNMGGTGIGNFNDRKRDAIRGGNFTDHGRAQGFTSGRFLFPNEEAEGGEADLQSLLDFADRIRVGMAGNLQTYEYENRFGEVVTGGNERIGYTLQPYETVNYIDKHDNETLWDNTQAKLPFDMEMEHRVDIHILSNALINYGQGVPFYQLGSDFLRSKSMDRNSFDSTDWFNTVDLSMQSHNWAIGLPPGWDNRDRWDEMRELMTLESINVEPKHMERSAEAFQHQLRIRYSSPLFRLRTGEDVRQRVAFHNTGPDQQPGILAMSITDDACAGDPLDPDRDGLLVLANAHNQTQQFTLPGTGYRLHPLETDRDNFHIQATDDQSTLFTLPAHRAVVFELPAGSSTTLACNPHFSTLQEPGAVIYFQAPEHWGSDIRAVPQPEGDEGLTISYTMQALDDHWFRMQLPDGMKQASIWFSDVSGNEAGPHHYPGSGCYTPDSEGWKPTAQCELPTFTVAFQKPDGWAETIHVYTFGPEQNGSWPGEPMARHGDGWYTAEYSAAQVSSGIIFNDASGNQTSDLFRDKAGCYENSRWVDSCTVLQQ